MKLGNIHISSTLAAIFLCIAAGACSDDDLASKKGESLPPDMYPLLLTASIDEMTSRADGSDPWGDGDEIAVQIGDYPATGSYKLNIDGSVKESDEPLSWPETDDYVKAWYPYVKVNTSLEKNIADQSDGYHDIDFLYARTDKEENYRNTVDLRFKHLMAKASCRLTHGEGVTDADLKTARVSYLGYTSVSFRNGTLTPGSDIGWITPYSNESALLVPQDMSGKELIKIDMTVTVNGVEIPKTLIYSPSQANLEAGHHYVYNIKVSKDRLVVESITASWSDNIKSGEPEIAVFIVNMPEDLPVSCREMLSFTKNVDNADSYIAGKESYLKVKGNEFKIFYPAETTTLLEFSKVKGSEIYPAPDSIKNPKEELELDKGLLYEVDFNLRSSKVDLKWDYLFISPKVGDYYYADGTWSHFYRAKKNCIGIVVQNTVEKTDTGNDDWLLPDEEIIGYVLAKDEIDTVWLVDVANGTIPEGPYKIIGKGTTTDCDGYSRTKMIVNNMQGYNTAAHMAKNWNPETPSPSSSSGWYLPSVSQMKNFIHTSKCYNLYSKSLSTCGGKPIETGSASSNCYWTSTLSNNSTSYIAYRNISSAGGTRKNNLSSKLRPVLTFTKPRNNDENE